MMKKTTAVEPESDHSESEAFEFQTSAGHGQSASIIQEKSTASPFAPPHLSKEASFDQIPPSFSLTQHAAGSVTFRRFIQAFTH